MRQQISFLTQSRFYSPAFNAAIFDGPVRIYFAQYQESLALKVYFMTQERLKNIYAQVRDSFRRTGINIFVMLYPSKEAFQLSFEESHAAPGVVVERLGHDFVVGVRGPITEADIETVYERIEEIARALTEVVPPTPLQRAAEEANA
jgi:hypothetical protein